MADDLDDAWKMADDIKRLIGKGVNAEFGVAGRPGNYSIEIKFPKEIARESVDLIGEKLESDLILGKNTLGMSPAGTGTTSLYIPLDKLTPDVMLAMESKSAIINEKLPKTASFQEEQRRRVESQRRNDAAFGEFRQITQLRKGRDAIIKAEIKALNRGAVTVDPQVIVKMDKHIEDTTKGFSRIVAEIPPQKEIEDMARKLRMTTGELLNSDTGSRDIFRSEKKK